MFYLGLVTMKEMSPKQWAKAAGTLAGGMESSAADPVPAFESVQSVQRQNLAFLGLARDPMGISSVQAGDLLWDTSWHLFPLPPWVKQRGAWVLVLPLKTARVQTEEKGGCQFRGQSLLFT